MTSFPSNTSSKTLELPLIKSLNFKSIINDIETQKYKTNKQQQLKQRKNSLWKSQNSKNQYNSNLLIDQELNVHKKILEIKKNIRDNQSQLTINALDRNFFSTSCINLIHQSNNIVKDKLNNEKSNYKDSVSKFISDNKEIYIKNNIIQLMNNEIQSLKNKEYKVSNVIREADTKLDNDLQDFNKFIEMEKENIRINEKKLSDVISENKTQLDHKRLLVQNNRQVIEDIDRIIKISINLMSYASFVCYALKIKPPSSFIEENFSLTNFEFLGNEQEVGLENFICIILENFQSVRIKVPTDPYLMINRTQDLEKKIIKVIEKNEELNRSILVERNESHRELQRLEDKLNEVIKENDALLLEYNKEIKHNNFSSQQKTNQVQNSYFKYFKELYLILNEEEIKKKKTLKKNEDMIKNIIDNLKSIEIKIINRTNFLIYFETQKPDEFLTFTNKRREFNKEKKVKDQQKKKQELDFYKQEKAKERSKRIVVKARKVAKYYKLDNNDDYKNITKTDNKELNDAALIYYVNQD